MSESGKREQERAVFDSKIPFFSAAVLVFLLCLFTGPYKTFTNTPLLFSLDVRTLSPTGFFATYALVWLLSIVLLLLAPRRFSQTGTTICVLFISLLCRLALLPQTTSGAMGSHPDITTGNPNFIIYCLSDIIPLIVSPKSLTLAVIVFDMAILCLLLILLANRGLSLRWSYLYAVNPVILSSVSDPGHTDVIAVFFLLSALCFYDRKQWTWMFVSAGLAILAQPFAIVTLPFLTRRNNWKRIWITMVVIVVCSIPFIEDYWRGLSSQLFNYGGGVIHNSPIHSLFRTIFDESLSGTAVTMVLLWSVLLFGCLHFHPEKNPRYANDPISGCFFVLGAWFVLSSAIHFHHLAWIVPFITVRPSASWMLLCLSISVCAYFAGNGASGGSVEANIPVWAQVLEWTPFYLMLLHNAFLERKRTRSPADDTTSNSISVVIPTLNEADAIQRCIQLVFEDPAVKEVIVVDSGSTDDTEHLAVRSGARVIHFKASRENGFGRGGQILAGIRAAEMDAVAIVHADTLAGYPVFEKILHLLRKQPMIVGGAVGSCFDSKGWKFRMLEFANDFRMICLGISFGDQIQFFRRKPVVDTRLFPNIPLMEDVEFSIRLHRLGRQTYLFGDALVSTRKWKLRGFGHAATVIQLFSAYIWQRFRGTPDTLAMYRKYYGKNASFR